MYLQQAKTLYMPVVIFSVFPFPVMIIERGVWIICPSSS